MMIRSLAIVAALCLFGTSASALTMKECRAKYKAEVRNSTMDVIVIGIGVLFFALSFAYVKACDRI